MIIQGLRTFTLASISCDLVHMHLQGYLANIFERLLKSLGEHPFSVRCKLMKTSVGVFFT